MASLDHAPVIQRIPIPREWRCRPAGLRRSWVVKAVSLMVPPVSFATLLQEFCPQQWRALPARRRDEGSCYLELLRNLPFPVNPWAEDYAQNWMHGNDESDYWWWDGVPINPQGFDDEGGYIDEQPLCVQLIWLIACSTGVEYQMGVAIRTRRTAGELVQRAPDALKKWGEAALVSIVRDGLPQDRPWLRESPAGRKWREPWQHCDMLVRWVQNSTGWGWLDETNLYLEECMCYPPWDRDEIRALIDNWRECEPVFNGIKQLAAFIDEGGRERLDLMARVIHGDTDAIMQVSR